MQYLVWTNYFALGLPEEHIQGVKKATDEIEIKVDGSNVVLKTPANERRFPLDKEIDEDVGRGIILKVSFLCVAKWD